MHFRVQVNHIAQYTCVSVHRIIMLTIICLWKVVKCHGCAEPYAVLQPLTSCSATLTFLHSELSSCIDDGCRTLQLQSLCHQSESNTDRSSWSDKKCTLEFISGILCKMPVLSCKQGISYNVFGGTLNPTLLYSTLLYVLGPVVLSITMLLLLYSIHAVYSQKMQVIA